MTTGGRSPGTPEVRRLPTASCPMCGKVRYLSRKQARDAARRLRGSGHLNAYRCGEFWHLGHLPDPVRAGRWSRDDLDRS